MSRPMSAILNAIPRPRARPLHRLNRGMSERLIYEVTASVAD